jgi:hypothetical protein
MSPASTAAWLLVFLGVVVVAATGASPSPSAVAGEAVPASRYWSASSPFNLPIIAEPEIDPRSEPIVELLRQNVIVDLYEYGIVIEHAEAVTPVAHVTCWERWGRCLPEEQSPLPIPPETTPPPGSDRTTVIVDRQGNRAIGLWQAWKQPSGSWEAAWGEIVSLSGSGISPQGGNGAGVSHLAGVVEIEEMQRGQIDHALVFSSRYVCEGEYRYPARKSDGESISRGCIPEGARIQLDPAVDVDALDAAAGTKIVARALQRYGAYALYFEVADDATSARSPGTVYADLGWDHDYEQLTGVPWDRLRVLAPWHGPARNYLVPFWFRGRLTL